MPDADVPDDKSDKRSLEEALPPHDVVEVDSIDFSTNLMALLGPSTTTLSALPGGEEEELLLAGGPPRAACGTCCSREKIPVFIFSQADPSEEPPRDIFSCSAGEGIRFFIPRSRRLFRPVGENGDIPRAGGRNAVGLGCKSRGPAPVWKEQII